MQTQTSPSTQRVSILSAAQKEKPFLSMRKGATFLISVDTNLFTIPSLACNLCGHVVPDILKDTKNRLKIETIYRRSIEVTPFYPLTVLSIFEARALMKILGCRQALLEEELSIPSTFLHQIVEQENRSLLSLGRILKWSKKEYWVPGIHDDGNQFVCNCFDIKDGITTQHVLLGVEKRYKALN